MLDRPCSNHLAFQQNRADDWNKVFFDSLNGVEYGPGSFLGMGSPYRT